MAPDVNQSTSSVMDFDTSKATTLNNSSDWDSSYSEVEISIESERAMTNDGSFSSSEEEEEDSESTFEESGAMYEELVEREDQKDESNEFVEDDQPEDMFAGANRQQHQNENGMTSSTSRHLQSPSRSGTKTTDKQDNNGRRRKTSFDAAENYDDAGRNRAPPNRESQFIRADRERNHSITADSITPTESDEITSSSRTKNEKKQAAASNAQKQSPSSIHRSHKSIKIPALHNHKQEGDDDYIRREIQHERERQHSRSLSRSEKSKSSGQKPRNRKNRNNRSRSRSNDKRGQEPVSERSLNGSSSLLGDNSILGSSSSNRNSYNDSKSNHQQRSISINPAPRRLASIHTSTPSNQLTGSTSKSNNTKHSNHDGSKRVSWKSDPKTSFSDWTLHVMYRDKNNKRRIDMYHVHRNVVGFGNRKSNFLLRDISKVELEELINPNNKTEVELRELLISTNKKRSSKDKESDKIITRLKLPSESQARSVPMVLDFMYYTNETKQRMSADRSCNVFKVAEGLEVHALQKAIGEFYMKNLSLKNLAEFLAAATKVKADKLLTICKAKIGQMITVKPELSAMVSPKFMAEILSISSKQMVLARKKEPKKYSGDLIVSQSRYWSKLACICAAKNEAIMTPKMFMKLTSEDCLPYIDVSATPKFLSMESNFLENRTNGRKAKQLTSLQRRCVESIGNDFDSFQDCFDSHQEIAESLKHLPSNILSEILMKLLTRP